MKNKKILLSILGLQLLVFQVLAPIQVLAANAFRVSVKNTVAGYSTQLAVSNIVPQTDVIFYVKKPDNKVVKVSATSSDSGEAKVKLSEEHTKIAGDYSVGALFNNGQKSSVTTFKVFPDTFDAEKSLMKASTTVIKADGKDQALIEVSLLDRFGNPFPSHQIQLVSSRSEDVIEPGSSNFTDEKGRVSFHVSSSKKGVSTLSAIDITSNKILSKRLEIAFVDGSDYFGISDFSTNDLRTNVLTDAGGYFDFINVARAASGSLHHFEITDIPSNTQPSQNVNFKVRALDENNEIVQNYTGTVHFSTIGSNGNNVSLPEDYTFKAEDLGVHEFNLGLSFRTSGTYKIAVSDTTNPLLKGEKDVVVGNSGSTSNSGTGSNSSASGSQLKPKIESPVPGTYSQNTQIISGLAPAGLKVKVFDNNQEIGVVQADNQGRFSFQATSLSDGVHKIHVVTLDANQNVKDTSEMIEFTLDSTAPKVDKIVLEPNANIQPGQVIQLKILTEENLSQVAAVFNSDIFQLNPNLNESGTYIASIKAPQEPGVYPIDVILVDQLGNDASYKAAGQLTIAATGGNASVGENLTPDVADIQNQNSNQPEVPTTPVEPTNLPPSTVTGLLAYASDKKVVLTWDSAQDDGTIKQYKVYYGLNPANLTQSVLTKDAATTWYIPNLENGKEYYFSITAVDDKQLESTSKSIVISSVPFATETSTLPQPTTPQPSDAGGDENMHGAYVDTDDTEAEDVDKITEGGPEMILLVSGSGLASAILFQLKKKRKFA